MCTRQLVRLAEQADALKQRDAHVLIVVSQEAFRAARWKRRLNIPFTLLADPTAWVCAKYGVAKQLMVHQEWVNVPSAFVVDDDGIVRYARVGQAYDDRASAEELLAALDRLGG
ncbi:MAG: peroxiredoxin family protein [Armatimonadota bacterium]